MKIILNGSDEGVVVVLNGERIAPPTEKGLTSGPFFSTSP